MGSTYSGTTTGTGARAGMVDILSELRNLTEASTSDYSLGAVTYWSDLQLQDILDRHAYKLDYELMLMVPTRKAGGYSYTDYYVGRKWLEQEAAGTSIFKIQDNTGATVGTALYTVDYNTGEVTFAADQLGAVSYMITCVSYDLNAAAAEVWRKKASHYASAYDFSTDNHAVKRSQLMAQAQQMVNYFLGLSNEGASNIPLERADDPGW